MTNSDTRLLEADAKKAFDAAIIYFKNQPIIGVDAIWGLKKVLDRHNDSELAKFVDKMIGINSKDPFIRLVDASAEFVELPASPGVGPKKLFNYLLSCVGKPPEIAISLLREFLSIKGRGYILAHQLCVIEWAQEVGRFLPKDIPEKKESFCSRLLHEQQNDKEFSDLYVERVAFLLLYHPDLNVQDVMEWMRTLVEKQQDDGSWGELMGFFKIDDDDYVNYPPATHSAFLGLLALSEYIYRHARSMH